MKSKEVNVRYTSNAVQVACTLFVSLPALATPGVHLQVSADGASARSNTSGFESKQRPSPHSNCQVAFHFLAFIAFIALGAGAAAAAFFAPFFAMLIARVKVPWGNQVSLKTSFLEPEMCNPAYFKSKQRSDIDALSQLDTYNSNQNLGVPYTEY